MGLPWRERRRNLGAQEKPGDMERKQGMQDGREVMPHDRAQMNINGFI